MSGRSIRTLRGHTNIIHSVAYSRDGTRLASTSDDRTVRVWDPATGAELYTLRGHKAGVAMVVFSADGFRLASACMDATAKIWTLDTGAPPSRSAATPRG